MLIPRDAQKAHGAPRDFSRGVTQEGRGSFSLTVFDINRAESEIISECISATYRLEVALTSMKIAIFGKRFLAKERER